MKKHSEDEKSQSTEGVQFGSGKQGYKKKHNISTKAKHGTLQENFSKVLVLALGHMGQKFTRRLYTKWAYMPVCSSKMDQM